MSWFPSEILFLVATNLDRVDQAVLSRTRKSNLDFLNPSLAGHKLFKALLDRDDDLVLYNATTLCRSFCPEQGPVDPAPCSFYGQPEYHRMPRLEFPQFYLKLAMIMG
jgi:hypothetical protein